MRIGWSAMTGLGMAGLLVAAAPAQAQTGTTGGSAYEEPGKSKTGSTSPQDTGTLGAYGSQAGMTGAQNEVTGRVEKLDQAKKELTLRLSVSDDTQVTKDGKRASLSDIKEGDQVRASFTGSGDQIKVNRIDVMSAKSPVEQPSKGNTGTRGY